MAEKVKGPFDIAEVDRVISRQIVVNGHYYTLLNDKFAKHLVEHINTACAKAHKQTKEA